MIVHENAFDSQLMQTRRLAQCVITLSHLEAIAADPE